uniref:DUF6161 domain-containing protein n=1 Tax=Mariniflexile sp. TaxID=1979402 RepID=UPI0040473F3F
MTNKEVEVLLKKAKSKEWFKSVTANFTYGILNEEFEKKGFFDIYQYVNRQCREWDKIDINLPDQFLQSRAAFKTILNELELFIKREIESDENVLKQKWSSISSKITYLNQNNRFPVNNPKTKFLIEVFKKGQGHFDGAFNYFFSGGNIGLTSKMNFVGGLMAYEYEFEDGSKIPKRRSAEKSSNSKIRNDFEKAFAETSQKVQAFISENESKSRNHTKEVLALVAEKQEAYESWFEECKKNDQDYTKMHLERVKDLEELYQEKLKLEAPAQYWRKRALQLSGEGKNWLKGLIAVSATAILALGAVLFFISDGTLKDLFSETGSAIRWSIVFITFVSFLAYAIRIFAKLTFSAYHLFRDAEEREQLAYVYLALKKEKNIDDTERHLIMQSLFSRADSGLLKDDASPTMPGGSMIEKLMGGK